MRGKKCDALIGVTEKSSPFDSPYDRNFSDDRIKRPMSYTQQQNNPALNIHTRRDVALQVNIFPSQPAVDQKSDRPNIMENNGLAFIPNAGIFRKQSTYVVVKGG